MPSIILISSFFTFFILSMKDFKKAINYLLIFFTFFLFIRFSLAGKGYEFNPMVALWIDSSIIGLFFPFLLRSRYKNYYLNNIVMLRIALMAIWFLMLLAYSFFAVGIDFIIFELFRDYLLFTIIALMVYVLVRENIENIKPIFKTIIGLYIIVLFFGCTEYLMINLFGVKTTELFYIKNSSLAQAGSYNYPVFMFQGIHIFKGFGMLITPHASSHFIVIGLLSLLSIKTHGKKLKRGKGLIINIVLLISLIGIVLLFIKSAWLMTLIGLLFIYKKEIIKLKIEPLIVFCFFGAIFVLFNYYFNTFIEIFIGGFVKIGSEFFLSDYYSYLNNNNLVTFFTGNGFLPNIQLGGISEVFLFEFLQRTGFIGLVLFFCLTGIPLFYSFNFLKSNPDINSMIFAFKAIIIVSYVSTIHYETLLNSGVQAIFYVSVGSLYAFKYWDKKRMVI